MKKLVYIESPFAGDRKRNAAYLKACMLDSLKRGEAPFASHALYTQFLDDDVPEERALGIEAGLAWGAKAELTVVYIDLGISGGMKLGIDRALAEGRPVEQRELHWKYEPRAGWKCSDAACDWIDTSDLTERHADDWCPRCKTAAIVVIHPEA